MLNYYQNYCSPINTISSSISIPGQLGTEFKPLYNGNISSMAVNIDKFQSPLVYNYKYDQLNRLTQMDAWKSNNENWAVLTKQLNYHEGISYDVNGNILIIQIMLTKEKRRQAIKQILSFCFLIIVAQSCNNHKGAEPDTANAIQKKNEIDSLSATIKKVEVVDKNASVSDTLFIGDIHIAIYEANNFFNHFKKNPGKFYYSEIERRDFFLLHDQTSKKYYLFGAENGGCLSCFGYVEFKDNFAFKKAILPEEIRDTMQFKPHSVAELKYKILEYPFLNLSNSLLSIEKKLIQAVFNLLTNKGKSNTYQKITHYSIISVFITGNEVSRISVQLNNDV